MDAIDTATECTTGDPRLTTAAPQLLAACRRAEIEINSLFGAWAHLCAPDDRAQVDTDRLNITKQIRDAIDAATGEGATPQCRSSAGR